jgi:phage baseplate assembly protein W
MPSQSISKGFSDISLSFQVNPLNKDLIILKNETAIARSIRNLVYTLTGEKFFNQDFGSKVSRSIFENVDGISADILNDEVIRIIKENEPRVAIIEAITIPNYDENTFDITLKYQIIGIDVPAQRLSFALQSVR